MKSVWIIFFLACIGLSSCNFNVTDIPGFQISSTISSSKRHNTFICVYKVKGNKINGFEIEGIFAEKRYYLKEGLFGSTTISCCESQLVIIFKEDNRMITLNDMPQNWYVSGFKMLNPRILIKKYNGTLFPDSISITIVPDVKTSQYSKITLSKVNN